MWRGRGRVEGGLLHHASHLEAEVARSVALDKVGPFQQLAFNPEGMKIATAAAVAVIAWDYGSVAALVDRSRHRRRVFPCRW